MHDPRPSGPRRLARYLKCRRSGEPVNHTAWIVILIVTFSLAAGCTKKDPAAPDIGTGLDIHSDTPPPPPSPGSIRVNINDTWRYHGGTDAQPEDVLVRVISSNESVVRLRSTTTDLTNGTSTNTVSTFDARTFALQVIEDGRLGATLRFDPALPILIPAEDHAYEGTVRVPTLIGTIQQPAHGNVTFRGLENVTVPAGMFETYHYEATFRTEGTFTFEQHVEVWFSPKVQQSVKSITDGRLQELVAFAPSP